MNLLYIHYIPRIISMPNNHISTNEVENCGTELTLSGIFFITLIVVNLYWLFVFIIAKIENYKINNNREKQYKDTLIDRDYFLYTSIFCACIDGIAIICGLAYWVFTLL